MQSDYENLECLGAQICDPLERIARALEVLALDRIATRLFRRTVAWSEGPADTAAVDKLVGAAESLAWRIREDHL